MAVSGTQRGTYTVIGITGRRHNFVAKEEAAAPLRLFISALLVAAHRDLSISTESHRRITVNTDSHRDITINVRG